MTDNVDKSDKIDNTDKTDKSDNTTTDKIENMTTTIVDHVQDENGSSCTVYKFSSRPPYEGFVLILVVVMFAILLIWWLVTHFT